MPYRLLLIVALGAAASASAAEPAKFELLDGDRVVFLGNTLVEREQKYGYWELMLTMAWPERNVTFRNLGWSGDTVWGESRAGFGTQADGFKALVEQVSAAKPTVIFVGYGNVEAFDGEAGLPRFVERFNKLLDELEKTKARIVVLGPIPQMKWISQNPNADAYNKNVDAYREAMRTVAKERGHRFADTGRELAEAQAYDAKYPANFSSGFFTAPDSPVKAGAIGTDLTEVGYVLAVKPIFEDLAIPFPGIDRTKPPDSKPLLTAILKKNELFFHRWRPQNETYLFGFRKHEQGNNAKEVFEFDPLVAAEEQKIAELRTKLAAELKKASESK